MVVMEYYKSILLDKWKRINKFGIHLKSRLGDPNAQTTKAFQLDLIKCLLILEYIIYKNTIILKSFSQFQLKDFYLKSVTFIRKIQLWPYY